MGRWKEGAEDLAQQQRDTAIANYFGLTLDEVEHWVREVVADTGNDDQKYGYIVYFDDETPKNVLSKVGKVENGNWVSIPTHVLDGDE